MSSQGQFYVYVLLTGVQLVLEDIIMHMRIKLLLRKYCNDAGFYGIGVTKNNNWLSDANGIMMIMNYRNLDLGNYHNC